MPLFECTNCHAVDNTALAGYWVRVYLDEQPALCSECNPAIGKWHSQFEKRTPKEAGLVTDPQNSAFLSPPGGWDKPAPPPQEEHP